MSTPERRRAARHAVDAQGSLFLSEARCIPVRIVNLGQLGALIQIADLEEAVLEGERVVLEHPTLTDPEGGEGAPVVGEAARTPGCVVRVDLEFSSSGVSRHLAIYFDGGAPPEGCTA